MKFFAEHLKENLMLILILRRIFERKAVPPNGIRRKAVIQIEPNQHIKLQRGEFEVFNNRLINHLIVGNEKQLNK